MFIHSSAQWGHLKNLASRNVHQCSCQDVGVDYFSYTHCIRHRYLYHFQEMTLNQNHQVVVAALGLLAFQMLMAVAPAVVPVAFVVLLFNAQLYNIHDFVNTDSIVKLLCTLLNLVR